MEQEFKINIFYSDEGEEIEDILSQYIINLLKEKIKENWIYNRIKL